MRTTMEDLHHLNDLLGQQFKQRLAEEKPLSAAMTRCLLQWLKQNGVTIPARPKSQPISSADMARLMEDFSPPDDDGAGGPAGAPQGAAGAQQ